MLDGSLRLNDTWGLGERLIVLKDDASKPEYLCTGASPLDCSRGSSAVTMVTGWAVERIKVRT